MSNTLHIINSGSKCSPKINTVSIKETLYSGKKCFLQLNTVNCKEKMLFGNNYFCHFTKIFVHLLIMSVVSNFSIFKFIGWDPANTCLKSIQTLEKVWNMFKLNSKDSMERCSGVFILNFEHISNHFPMWLLFTITR